MILKIVLATKSNLQWRPIPSMTSSHSSTFTSLSTPTPTARRVVMSVVTRSSAPTAIPLTESARTTSSTTRDSSAGASPVSLAVSAASFRSRALVTLTA